MLPINIPDQSEISGKNQEYIEYFNKKLGQVPNLYKAMMHSAYAFDTFYTFHGRKTSLSIREREVVSLVMAEVNQSLYCLSAHTMIAKLNGFSEEEIMQLRQGRANFDTKLDALAQLVKQLAEDCSRSPHAELDDFFAAGYAQSHLIDVLWGIGENVMSNLIAKTLQVPIDFPLAQKLNQNG